MIQPTLINLHLNEYSQEFHYCPLAVKLDRCVGSCNTLNDLSNKVCIPNKTEHLNLNAFNMITFINELETLTKHISCECECKLDGTKCNLNQWCNNDKCQYERKKNIFAKKIMFGVLLYVTVKMQNKIICDEVIDIKEKNFNEKKYNL